MLLSKVATSLALIIIISVPANTVIASSKSTSPALKQFRLMEKSKGKFYVKSRTTIINRNIKKAARAFWVEGSDCFGVVVETYSFGVIRNKKRWETVYTPTMSWLGKNSAIFGLQFINKNNKGKDRAIYIGGGKPQKNGTFILTTKFDSVGKNKTKMTSYFTWGPVGKRLAKASEKWAAGKKGGCPTKYM